MRYLVGLIFVCLFSSAMAQNKDTVLVNLTNFKLYPGTFSWRGTNTHSTGILTWDSGPFTEGHLQQGTVFRMNYRLMKPVGYDANYSAGYPMIVMLHGGGERGNCWDTNCYYGTPSYSVTKVPTGATTDQLKWLMSNENVLGNGGSAHLQAVNLAGTTKAEDANLNPRAFPGFVLFPQNINGWGNENSSNSDISFAIRIVRLLARQYNIDPNRIYVHGLSLGGQGVYKALNMADWLFAGAATMSAIYTNNIEADSISAIPLWAFQGGQDTQVTPAQTQLMLNKLRNVGGTTRYTLYPNLGHGTWNAAYAEPDFFTWLLSHNKANIHVAFDNPYMCGTTGAGVKLSLAQGFYAYQWEKDGKIISGATGYVYMVNEPGIYRARFSRISKNPTEQQWNRWSDPVTISEKSPDQPIVGQVNSVLLNDLNNTKNATLSGPAGFDHYYWYKNGTLSTLPDAQTVTISGCSIQPSFPCAQSGRYTLVTMGIDKCPSPSSKDKYVTLGMSSATNPLPIISKPTNFAGKVLSPSSVLLTWIDAAKNERGYEVWRRKSTDANTQWKMATLTDEDATLFYDTGLEPSTTYYYKIRGVNNTGRSDYAPGNSGTNISQNLVVTTTADAEIPTPPQNLTANVVGINKITLTWTASTDDSGIKDYYVYYNTDSVLIGSTNTTYTLNNTRLVLNTYYNLTVRAVDYYGNLSSKSNQVRANTFVDGLYYEHSTGAWTDITKIPFTTAVPEFTGKVPNITLAPRTQDDFFDFRFYGYIYLNIGSSGTTTNTSYAFQLNSNDGAELYIDDVRLIQRKGTVTDGACTSSSKTALQLTAGYHKIEVRYFEYTGSQCLELRYRGPDTKPASGNATFILVPDAKLKSYNVLIPPSPPIAPFNLVANAAGMSQIDLTWQFSGTPPVNYEVYRGSSAAGPFTMVSRVSSTVYSDKNLTPGTNYFYEVRTVTNNGVSGFTSIANATTLTDSQAPTQPTSLAVVSSTFTKASLTWSNSTDNVKVTGYEIWANGVLIGTSNVTGYLATNLTPNTLYKFTIIAYDASGNKSIASAQASITTSTPDIYYSNASGNLNDISTWGKNADGSGANVSTFSNNGQYFVVSNRSTSSLGGTWSVEGSISKVVVPDGITLTVDNTFTARVEVQGNGRIDLNSATVPNLISISPTSTINYNAPTNIAQMSYGNLGLGGTGNKVFPSGDITVAGNLTATNGIGLKGASGNASKVLLGGDLTFNGSPGAMPADFGINLQLTKNGTQTITSGGDLYFYNIKNTNNGNINVVSSSSPITLNLGSFASGGLSVANGTTLNLANNNISISHSGTINGSNETGRLGINGGDINIESNSSANSNLYFDPTNNKIKFIGMDLSGSGDLLFQEDALVADGIKISNGELNAGGHITLLSNATQTASIQQIDGTGKITGDVSVQRYLDAKGKIYRYIATSVQGVKVSDWQKYFPITGAFTGGSTGFTNNPSMFAYDNGAWQDYPAASGSNADPISIGIGYAAFLRNGTSPITLEVKGNPVQGDFTFNVDPDPSSTITTDGWNLLGNPYASTITWGTAGWIQAGINTTISVRDNPTGVFKYYDYVTHLGTLTNGEIAPGQAFWVQSVSATPSLTITEKAKTTDQETLFRTADDPVSHVTMILRQASKEDHTFVAFTKNGTDNFDNESDAIKQQNVGLYNFSTLSADDADIAINNMSDEFCSKTVKLNIQNAPAGSYSIQFNDIQSLIGVGKIVLHDNLNNSDIEITDGYEHSFSITSNANSYGKNRFYLTFSRPALNTNITFSSEDVCGNGGASITITNTQAGVEYFAINNYQVKISDAITGTGGDVTIQIKSDQLVTGSNTIKVGAGFKGCDNVVVKDSTQFNYTLAPEATTSSEVNACQGSSVTLTATGAPSSGYYKWYDENVLEISGSNVASFKTPELRDDTDYFVSALTQNGCEGEKQHVHIFIESFDTPELSIVNDTLFATGTGILQWFKDGEQIFGATDNYLKPTETGQYSVAETGDCARESEPVEYIVMGLESSTSGDLKISIFPNPAKGDNVNVEISTLSNATVAVKMIDLLGKSFYSNAFNDLQSNENKKLLFTEKLRSGVYFLIATQKGKTVKQKVIICD